MLKSSMIMFLLEIGRWAKDRLTEIWTINDGKNKIQLTETDAVKNVGSAMLQNAIATKGEAELAAIKDRIDDRRELILMAEQAKIDDEKALMLGQITLAVKNARERDANANIVHQLRLIEVDLQALGFTVEK